MADTTTDSRAQGPDLAQGLPHATGQPTTPKPTRRRHTKPGAVRDQRPGKLRALRQTIMRKLDIYRRNTNDKVAVFFYNRHKQFTVFTSESKPEAMPGTKKDRQGLPEFPPPLHHIRRFDPTPEIWYGHDVDDIPYHRRFVTKHRLQQLVNGGGEPSQVGPVPAPTHGQPGPQANPAQAGVAGDLLQLLHGLLQPAAPLAEGSQLGELLQLVARQAPGTSQPSTPSQALQGADTNQGEAVLAPATSGAEVEGIGNPQREISPPDHLSPAFSDQHADSRDSAFEWDYDDDDDDDVRSIDPYALDEDSLDEDDLDENDNLGLTDSESDTSTIGQGRCPQTPMARRHKVGIVEPSSVQRPGLVSSDHSPVSRLPTPSRKGEVVLPGPLLQSQPCDTADPDVIPGDADLHTAASSTTLKRTRPPSFSAHDTPPPPPALRAGSIGPRSGSSTAVSLILDGGVGLADEAPSTPSTSESRAATVDSEASTQSPSRRATGRPSHPRRGLRHVSSVPSDGSQGSAVKHRSLEFYIPIPVRATRISGEQPARVTRSSNRRRKL